MKKTIFSTLAIASFAISPSFAADDIQIDEARFDWSGGYIGAQAGRASGDVDWVEGPDVTSGYFNGAVAGAFITAHSPSGSVYGVTGGYNWQFDEWVLGIEGSWSNASIDDTSLRGILTMTTEIDSIITVGPRIGYAFDNILIYGEGGYASADVDTTSVLVGGFPGPVNTSERHSGYYLGAGIEYALNENWVIGFEYNRISLDDEVHFDPVVPGFPFTLDSELTDFTISTYMGRIAYKF